MQNKIVSASAASPSLIYQPRSIVERLPLEELFSQSRPLEIELGSGDGTFLVEYAGLHPECNFLGVERLLGRLRKIDRKGRRAGLTNLRVMRLEASYVVEYLLPPGCVSAMHIYFPDPWPKRKHTWKRLINKPFTALAARVLASGGTVYLRTDNADYFAQMTSAFGDNTLFQAVDTPAELRERLTDFERDFLARGVETLRAAYRRAPA